ncbi:hypothetical protein FIE12Z_7909 [Fusarium flagelliforme]|uniref:Cyclase n=1 Tax=Fusarium flagelliforme TaxID=2675880 RepID=A0A395MIS2_9HYPO|nr:hypothetical protein FIE12Z_7909 [Fusarium flagelliforme]
MSTKPSFDSLPLRKDGPAGNAWGLFGNNDECGMLNLLTPDIVTKAASEIRDGSRVSTDWPLNPWVERGGIVGRGVLLDYASWADNNNIALTPFETKPITVTTLKKVAESQGTTIRQGDILFIRTGWVRAYDKLSDEECKTLADHKVPPAHGIESSEETLRWLWDQGFSAVAGDQPSMEAWPCQNTDFFLHEWLLAGWGMPIGELFDLEALSPWRRGESTEWRGDLLINWLNTLSHSPNHRNDLSVKGHPERARPKIRCTKKVQINTKF